MELKNMIFRNMHNEAICRGKWVEKCLKGISMGESILDAGAGEGRYRTACAHLKYFSQDFCEYDGKASAGLDRGGVWDTSSIDIVSDIIDIPIENGSMDNILCTEVLEHIPSPELAIKEFSRVLKKNGKLILTAPFASYTHMAPYHYCSGFDKYWFETILPRYGFEIEEMESNGNYFDMLALDLRRTPLMASTYAKKMNIIEKSWIYLTIQLLNHISKRSIGSEDFATFEYMVLARKVK